MQPADLAARLVRRGALRVEGAQLALRRHRIYGGGLDTILLELGLVEEPELWRELVEATGLPPLPPAMLDGPVIDPELMIDVATARRLGGLPLATRDGDGPVVDVIVRPGYDAGGLRAAIGAERHRLYIVPEPRFVALLGAFYGEPVPPRILSLLGRLMGAEQVRRWAATQTTPTAPPPPLVETGPGRARAAKPAAERPAVAFEPPVVAAPPAVADPPAVAEVMPSVEQPEPTREPPPPEPDVQVAVQPPVVAEPTPQPVIAAPPSPPEPEDAADVAALLDAYAALQGSPHGVAAERRIRERVSALDVASALPGLSEQAARAALDLLGRGGDWSAPAIRELLESPDGQRQRWGADALASTGARGFEERLVVLARGSDRRLAAAALRALRPSLEDAAVAALAAELRHDVGDPDVTVALTAIGALAELRDPEAVAPLIDRVGSKPEPVATAARAALVSLTAHDPGGARWRWTLWWRENQTRHRIEWLIDALDSPREELRLAASSELRELTDEYFGYAFDLEARERHEARKRWETWWKERGHERFARR